MKDSYERRVNRGVKLLDKERPDWFRKVDTSTLNMASGTSCILGQAFKDAVVGHAVSDGFEAGLRELNLREGEAARFGFDATRTYGGSMRPSYDHLAYEWRRAIAQRYFVEAIRLSA